MKMGKLIIIEGPDTSGKTTLIKKLKEVLPIIYTNETFLFTREPGNLLKKDNTSETIREKLLTDRTLSVEDQTMEFAKARYFHTIDILKELKKGNNVIADRYILSSLLYQGLHLGQNKVLEVNKDALNLLKESHITMNQIVLCISDRTYNERMNDKQKDAMEDISTIEALLRIQGHNTLREGYDAELGYVFKLDANLSKEHVVINALNTIHQILKI